MKSKLLPLVMMFLVVLILTPGLLLGFLANPWFFLILFLLMVLFPLALAPRVGNTSEQHWTRSPVVWVLAIAALVFVLPALLLGILLNPGLFLIVLLVLLPLLWVGFGH